MSQHNISPEQIENDKVYKEMGLSDEEYQLAKNLLKRLPNYTETGIFSAMWSEHWQLQIIKNHYLEGSRRRKPSFTRTWLRVLGLLILVTIKLLFKIESHNESVFR